MQRFKRFGSDVKLAIKTNTQREQKIYDKLQQNVGKIEDQFLKQARRKDPMLDRAISNEQKRLGYSIKDPSRKGDINRLAFRREQLKSSGYTDFAKMNLKQQGKQLAKGVSWEGHGIMGKFEEFKEKQGVQQAGAQGSRLKEKWAKIAKRQRKGIPSLNPSDVREYAQRIGGLAKKYYGKG
jgi:hypothetical protein